MTPRPHLWPVAALALLVGLAAMSRAMPAPWLINETPSLPRGLYLRIAAAPLPGAVVAVSPPASARPYLSRLAAPEGARLLKRVAAVSGEAVCGDGARLTWRRGQAIALTHDRQGTSLAAWRGCRRLRPGELLVLGDSPSSFDSRYFGPVRTAAVEGVYREVLRW